MDLKDDDLDVENMFNLALHRFMISDLLAKNLNRMDQEKSPENKWQILGTVIYKRLCI